VYKIEISFAITQFFILILKNNFFQIIKMNKIIILMISLLSSCKNKDTLEPLVPVQNLLCNGNSTNSFFPITSNFIGTWKVFNSDPVETEKNSYIRDTIINLIGYKIVIEEKFINNEPTGIVLENYYRTDIDGNVYKYFSEFSNEFLFVPINPVADSTIANYPVIEGTYFRKVIDANSSFVTLSCEYIGLLKIQETIDTEDDEPIINTYYYKNGLGLIAKEIQNGGISSVYHLSEINFD
jgi:hypothetical protein